MLTGALVAVSLWYIGRLDRIKVDDSAKAPSSKDKDMANRKGKGKARPAHADEDSQNNGDV
jgi:hypothetical protein